MYRIYLLPRDAYTPRSEQNYIEWHYCGRYVATRHRQLYRILRTAGLTAHLARWHVYSLCQIPYNHRKYS